MMMIVVVLKAFRHHFDTDAFCHVRFCCHVFHVACNHVCMHYVVYECGHECLNSIADIFSTY